MISGVPTSEELTERADSLLQLSYSIVSKLYENQRDDWRHGADNDQIREYWQKCAPSLANALALLQQSHELYLKGKIAAVSPYLLLAREPQHWPKKSLTEDVPFSDFLTVGASELPRLHDMVCNARLDDRTRMFLTTIRERRNAFVHQGQAPTSTAAELFEAVLRTFKWAHPDTRWFAARQEHLENDHLSALFNTDHISASLHAEFSELQAELKPAEFVELLGFNKKRRWYYCPECERHRGDYGDVEMTAQLEEGRNPSAIVCLVCEASTSIYRRECFNPDCKSDVYAVETDDWDETCRTCGAGEGFMEELKRREALFGSMDTREFSSEV
ncbi:hypothetical protein ACC719_11620 [Rhizobium ruizarguesonis]